MKHNLGKCDWQESKTCALCHHSETIKHMFFRCKFAVISHLDKFHLISNTKRCESTPQLINGVDPRFKLLIEPGAITVI
jgi:hypothetical protein